MTVQLSLLAAASYGLSDINGGIFSRRAGAWAVALVAQLGGTACVLVVVALTGGSPTTTDLAWAVLAGVANGFGTAFLYRGLASGRMGVVAPVSGVGAVILPVVVGLLSGERPGGLVWLGVLLALPAIWLVSREPTTGPTVGVGSGLLDGVLAGVGFGTLFIALAQIPSTAGFLPLALQPIPAAALAALLPVFALSHQLLIDPRLVGRGRRDDDPHVLEALVGEARLQRRGLGGKLLLHPGVGGGKLGDEPTLAHREPDGEPAQGFGLQLNDHLLLPGGLHRGNLLHQLIVEFGAGADFHRLPGGGRSGLPHHDRRGEDGLGQGGRLGRNGLRGALLCVTRLLLRTFVRRGGLNRRDRFLQRVLQGG